MFIFIIFQAHTHTHTQFSSFACYLIDSLAYKLLLIKLNMSIPLTPVSALIVFSFLSKLFNYHVSFIHDYKKYALKIIIKPPFKQVYTKYPARFSIKNILEEHQDFLKRDYINTIFY